MKTTIEHDDLSIVRALEEDIIFGRLAPGTRLTEDTLLVALPRDAPLRPAGAGAARGDGHRRARAQQGRDRALADAATRCRRSTTCASCCSGRPRCGFRCRRRDALIDGTDRDPRGAWPARRRGLSARRARDQRPLPPDAVRRLRQPASGADDRALHAAQPAGARQLDGRARSRCKISHEHHRLMIEMLKGTDNWVLAQLCVDHLQPSKKRYLDHVSENCGRAPERGRERDLEATALPLPLRVSPVEAQQRHALTRQRRRADRSCRPRRRPCLDVDLRELSGGFELGVVGAAADPAAMPIAFQTPKALEWSSSIRKWLQRGAAGRPSRRSRCVTSAAAPADVVVVIVPDEDR